ncbi:MAG: FAD-dependent oxidoreductase [Fimbriimonadales bacterium]|nr:FAD-dependent oxidoreductase [Fimbriimonadales bacterium]
MRVAVVGAGVSGLAAARELAEAGVGAVLFEASGQVGGRLLSWRAEPGLVFDVGATLLAPVGEGFAALLESLPADERPERIRRWIAPHQGLRALPADPARNAAPRFAFRDGNQRLAERLADGLELRFGAPVEWLDKAGREILVRGEPFDACVLAVPGPIAADLLATLGERRPLRRDSYRSCLSVALGYPMDAPDLPWFALLDPDQTHPLGWLSLESRKVSGRAPSGWAALVAQLSARASSDWWGLDDDTVVQRTSVFVGRLFGRGWDSPSVARVFRWTHSQPELAAPTEAILGPESRVALAGDAFGKGRVEYAWEAGRRAARLLLGGG